MTKFMGTKTNANLNMMTTSSTSMKGMTCGRLKKYNPTKESEFRSWQDFGEESAPSAIEKTWTNFAQFSFLHDWKKLHSINTIVLQNTSCYFKHKLFWS